jgi:hypothetical protein
MENRNERKPEYRKWKKVTTGINEKRGAALVPEGGRWRLSQRG